MRPLNADARVAAEQIRPDRRGVTEKVTQPVWFFI